MRVVYQETKKINVQMFESTVGRDYQIKQQQPKRPKTPQNEQAKGSPNQDASKVVALQG
jgi:hypothetical protein